MKRFFPYSLYFLSGFFSFLYMFPLVRQSRKRRQSVLTLLASLALCPFGIGEIAGIQTIQRIRDHSPRLFVSYALWDTLLGMMYYPEGFTFVEGWLHHSVSSVFALHCLLHHRTILFSKSMIVEIPTILLSLIRVFPQKFQKPFYRKIMFPLSFAVFRLVIFNILLLQENQRGNLDTKEAVLGGLFFLLNAKWWVNCIKKEWLQKRQQ